MVEILNPRYAEFLATLAESADTEAIRGAIGVLADKLEDDGHVFAGAVRACWEFDAAKNRGHPFSAIFLANEWNDRWGFCETRRKDRYLRLVGRHPGGSTITASVVDLLKIGRLIRGWWDKREHPAWVLDVYLSLWHEADDRQKALEAAPVEDVEF